MISDPELSGKETRLGVYKVGIIYYDHPERCISICDLEYPVPTGAEVLEELTRDGQGDTAFNERIDTALRKWANKHRLRIAGVYTVL